jgi:hypothetical protein
VIPKCPGRRIDDRRSFIPANGACPAFPQSLPCDDALDAQIASKKIQRRLLQAIHNSALKYAALAVLACLSVSLGEDGQMFAGYLSPIDTKLLNVMC